MTVSPAVVPLDTDTVARLSAALHRLFESLEADDDLFTDDAFFDILPPLWRFQIQGAPAFIAQLRSIAGSEVSVAVLRTVPTVSGFVMETEETHRMDKLMTVRHLWVCEVRDGRVAEMLGYCNGGWDEELRARHAAEAPMFRP